MTQELVTLTVRVTKKFDRQFEKLCDETHRSKAGMLRFLMEREIETAQQSKDLEDAPRN